MRKTILTALAVLAIGGVGGWQLVANAQPAPPPPGADGPPAHPGPWMEWMQRAHGWRDRGPGSGLRQTFALVYRQEDRQLTPSDVQKIAEAFLLWHGNHTWKVTEVAPAADGSIGFAIATPDGTVIARFTMDPHTARVTRTG